MQTAAQGAPWWRLAIEAVGNNVLDRRHPRANRPTPPRKHKHNRTMHAQQNARFLRGRFK
ncbi:MAG: hypothetical protein ACREQ5_21940 [Candidatus Dormibacteria bacterium]